MDPNTKKTVVGGMSIVFALLSAVFGFWYTQLPRFSDTAGSFNMMNQTFEEVHK